MWYGVACLVSVGIAYLVVVIYSIRSLPLGIDDGEDYDER